MHRVDLNCDVGESFGHYTIGNDREVMRYITSANVACGVHASDPAIMAKSVALAKSSGVRVGAHPGFPDLQGFGRRQMRLSTEEIRAYVIYQVGALYGFCRAEGVKMQHVKPHGALANMAARDDDMADAICRGIAAVDPGLILLGPGGSCLNAAALRAGLPVANEVYADRAYEEDGSLVSRSKPGAVIFDKETAVRRVLRMVKEGSVLAVTGKELPVQADSICVHADTPGAAELIRTIREALMAENVQIGSLA